MGAPEHETILDESNANSRYWRDLWQFRELLHFLVWRDILVRYKQTAIGITWALIRPFLTMIVFTVIFSKIANLSSNGAPYPILVFAALLPWQLFANSLSECGGSLISNSNLISKVYFPRLIIPASSVVVGLVDFAISIVFLVSLMLYYSYIPSPRIVLLPVFTIGALLVAGGAGLWLSALTVKYRDFKFVIPFLVQFGLYVSPVGFSSSVVPESWRLLYSLNPMVGIIDGFRWSILGHSDEPYWPGISISGVAALALLASGIWYFRKTECEFADII